MDPLASQAPRWQPYRPFFDNPINYIDPSGTLETRYEDEDGTLLLNTDDGSDNIVTVANYDVENFKEDVSIFDGNEDVLNTEIANNWLTRNHGLYVTYPYNGPTARGGSGSLEL